jgi:hypothetical protein
MLDEALRAAVMDDAAGVDEEQLITHFSEFREDMRTDENGLSPLREEPDQILELDARFGIEASGWFVEDEHFRVMNERAPEAQPLAHALGQLVHRPIGDRKQIREIHDLPDAFAPLWLLVSERPAVKIEIFENGHVFVGSVPIGHPAHAMAHLCRVFPHILAADADGSRGWPLQGDHHSHRRCLAGAIGSDEAGYLTRLDLKGDAIDSLNVAEIALKVFYLDDRIGHQLSTLNGAAVMIFTTILKIWDRVIQVRSKVLARGAIAAFIKREDLARFSGPHRQGRLTE